MKISFGIALGALTLALVGCKAQAGGSLNVGGDTPEPAAAAPAPPKEDPEDVRIEGDHLVIDRHINFAVDSHEILEDSFDLLDHIAQLLKNHPEIKTLHVIGHTDAAGGPEHNMELSDKRANSVVEALRSRGATQTIDAKGKGETEHLCSEDTDECHQKNRRVEFIIEKAEG
jgi:peptidoglycan-associated lipoprotein